MLLEGSKESIICHMKSFFCQRHMHADPSAYHANLLWLASCIYLSKQIYTCRRRVSPHQMKITAAIPIGIPKPNDAYCLPASSVPLLGSLSIFLRTSATAANFIHQRKQYALCSPTALRLPSGLLSHCMPRLSAYATSISSIPLPKPTYPFQMRRFVQHCPVNFQARGND